MAKKKLLRLSHCTVLTTIKEHKHKNLKGVPKNINPLNLKKLNHFFYKMRKILLLTFENFNYEQFIQLDRLMQKKSLYNPLTYFVEIYHQIDSYKNEKIKEREFKIVQLITNLLSENFFEKVLELTPHLQNHWWKVAIGADLFHQISLPENAKSYVNVFKKIENSHLFEGIVLADIYRSQESLLNDRL